MRKAFLTMDYDPEYSLKTNAELNTCLFKYTEEHDVHTRAVAELSRREKAAEERLAKAIFWSRLAAILALPGALYVVWRIVSSLLSSAGSPGR